jgi:hypothetical protein
MTTLVFSDKDRDLMLRGLTELAGQESIRLEQQVAALEASSLLKSLFGLSWWDYSDARRRDAREKILGYQQYNGGVANLPYGESVLYTSVWMASLGGNYVSQGGLALYFEDILDNTAEYSDDQSVALWGAAACGRPVLPDIRRALRDNSFMGHEMSARQKLNLICALTFIGSGNDAYEYAFEFINTHTEDLGGPLRASGGLDETDTLLLSAQMAVIASVLDLPQRRGLYQYIQENRSGSEYLLLEKLICLSRGFDASGEAVNFTYNLDGQKVTVDLRKSNHHSLTLTPQQLTSIVFESVEGAVMVQAQYMKDGMIGQNPAARSHISLRRRYEVDGRETTVLPTVARVRVGSDFELDEQAPDGCYTIRDYLPAGLRYVAMSPRSDDTDMSQPVWFLNEDGGRLTFGTYKDKSEARGRLEFIARVASPGEYKAEPATISHSALAGMYGAGDETHVSIK